MYKEEYKKSIRTIEYRKHIIGVMPLIGRWSIGLCCFLILSVLILVCFFAKYKKEYDALDVKQYSWIVESNDIYDDYNYLKKSENLISIFNKNGKVTNSNTYYIQKDEQVPIESFSLGENEIAISRKTAEVLNVDKGDTVLVELPVFENKQEYVIKEVFGYNSDFYNVEENIDFSAVVIGCDLELIDKTSGFNVYFLSDREGTEFIDNNYSYIARYKRSNDLAYLKKIISIGSIAETTVFLIVLVVFAFLIWGAIDSEINKFYLDGYNSSTTKLFRIKDRLIFYDIPVGIYVVMISVSALNKMISYQAMIMIVVFAVASTILSLLIGRKRYERVN